MTCDRSPQLQTNKKYNVQRNPVILGLPKIYNVFLKHSRPGYLEVFALVQSLTLVSTKKGRKELSTALFEYSSAVFIKRQNFFSLS